MSNIEIKKIGITNVGTECIVNAANEGLWEGGGVCGIIFKAAGSSELTKACKKIGHCDTGSAVITPAFQLKAKYIIHAVGPVWKNGKNKEPQLLYSCYRKSLELAKENNCHSIGFPLISSGIFGYPMDKAWCKAIQACNDFIKNNSDYEMNIVFAVIDDNVLETGNFVLEALTNYKVENTNIKTNHTKKMHPKDIELLQGIDYEKLRKAIEYFCQYRKVEWNGGQVIGKTEEGKNIISWPHAGYTKEAFDYIQLMPADLHYGDTIEKYCKNVLPTDMNPRQIRAKITWILRGEKFCDGHFAMHIEDGTVLKLLLRLDDLIKMYEGEYK